MTGLDRHLAGGVTTVCRAWILGRRDGVVMGFTDHDGAVEVDGVRCAAATGFDAGAVERGTGLAVATSEVVGALSADAITAADVRAGRWDGAGVVGYLVNWAAPSERAVTFRGRLGEIVEGGGRFTAELRGLSDALNAVRGRIFQRRCDAVLGDGRCGADLALTSRVAEVALHAVEEDGAVLVLDRGAVAVPEGGFAHGRCLWLDGAALGLEAVVADDVAAGAERRLRLRAAPRAAARPGDLVRLTVGCDRRFETCRDRFGNASNFRGFPHVPGEDWLVAGPVPGAVR